jgi:hypothetical protein
MKRAVTIILLLFAAILAAAGIYFYRHHGAGLATIPGLPPDLMSQLPPDAPAVAYVDVAALRVSPFFAQIAASLPAAQQDPEYTEFVRATGFDYTRDLDRVALAAWPGSPAASVLALAEGRFDRERIAQYALRYGTVSSRGDKQLYQVRVNGPAKTVSFLFLTPNRIALATGTSLDTILAAAPDGHADPAMRQRLQRVAGSSLFGVARTDDLPKDLALDTVHSDQLDRLLRSVHYVTLIGRPDAERFNLALDGECDSSANALQLATLLDGLRWLGRAALADPKTRRQLQPQAAMLLDKLLRLTEVSHQDHRVDLRLALTPEMLSAALKPSRPGAR